MSRTWRFILTQFAIPIGAGAAAAWVFFPHTPASGRDVATAPAPRDLKESRALPDDPELIKLAALSGRTAEARQKLAAGLAAGATNEELAEWLTPILIADPGWLDQFIKTVPEERRITLVREVFPKLVELQPDAAWELIRRSPFALTAATAKVPGDQYPGLRRLGSAGSSPLATEALFDPAMHFSDADIDHFCRLSLGYPVNAQRILEEWQNGRWKDQNPDWVRGAWLNLKADDPVLSQALEQSLPADLAERATSFEAFGKLFQEPGTFAKDLKAQDLSGLSAPELASLCGERALAGSPVPLETLSELPLEMRGEAIRSYITNLYPFSADVMKDVIGRIDDLHLSREEKQSLLYESGCAECNQLRDYDTAMKWFSQIPDETVREKVQKEAVTELLSFDPSKALGYIRAMPPGPARDELEKAAIDAQP